MSRIILLAMHPPVDENHPYRQLEKKLNIQIVFEPLTKVEPISVEEFRKRAFVPGEDDVLVFPNRQAIDLYFQRMEEIGSRITREMKINCLFWNESTAYYIQKYVPLKKRRMLWGEGTPESLLLKAEKKFRDKKLYYIGAEEPTAPLYQTLKEAGFQVELFPVYRITTRMPSSVSVDEVDLWIVFTGRDARALVELLQKAGKHPRDVRVGAYGSGTIQVLEELGFSPVVRAPTDDHPSLFSALEDYLRS